MECRSPDKNEPAEGVVTNGPSNGVDSGSALVDMDSVSVTPAVPSPAPLSSMTATPDSNVEAGHNDTGNILRHLLMTVHAQSF